LGFGPYINDYKCLKIIYNAKKNVSAIKEKEKKQAWF